MRRSVSSIPSWTLTSVTGSPSGRAYERSEATSSVMRVAAVERLRTPVPIAAARSMVSKSSLRERATCLAKAASCSPASTQRCASARSPMISVRSRRSLRASFVLTEGASFAWSNAFSTPSRHFRFGLAASSLSTSSPRCAAVRSIAAIGLFSSWATPAANSPSEAKRAWLISSRRASSRLRKAVLSRARSCSSSAVISCWCTWMSSERRRRRS